VLTRFDEAARRFTGLRTIFAAEWKIRHDRAAPVRKRRTFSVWAPIGAAMFTFPSSERPISRAGGERVTCRTQNGQPAWSPSEADAVPVVLDNPLNVPNHTPGIGNVSVIYSNELRLWLMTYDNTRGSPETRGFYFTSASEPWGP
jgi:hypothetical protein